MPQPRQGGGGDGSGVCGVLLAAGAGRRAGGPKALRTDPDGTSWLVRSIAVLRDGGCSSVVVVLGCAADAARDVIAGSVYAGDRQVSVVEAADWGDGMGVSLRAGLAVVQSGPWRAALVHLVDLPDVTAPVVSRLIEQAPTDPEALARVTFDGRPGHPVLIGASHVPAVMGGLTADRGAQDYLVRLGATGVECGDLATGEDRDQ